MLKLIKRKIAEKQKEKALQDFMRVEFSRDYELLRQANMHENRCMIDAMIRNSRIGG